MQKIKQKVSKYFFYLISVCYVTEGIVDVVVASAWPVIAHAIGADISLIGILVMMYYIGAIITSPNTYKLRRVLGTNYTMILSQICFVVALLLYIIANNIYVFAIGMLINGMGCGFMEINANSYVLKAYDVKEESILYGFWGIGSVVGSTVMALVVKYHPHYQRGFVILVVLLVINIILLLFAKASWQKQKKTLPENIVNMHSVSEEEKTTTIKYAELIKDKRVILVFMCFLLSHGVILTANSLISTIAEKQGFLSDSLAVVVPTLYFAAIFIGRTISGNIFKKETIINVLKANTFTAALLLIILNIIPSSAVVVCVILLGLVMSPIIPFLYAYIKEQFEITHLSALIGYGDVFGIIGTIIVSCLSSFIMKMVSIQAVEIIFAVLLIFLYLLLVKAEKEK